MRPDRRRARHERIDRRRSSRWESDTLLHWRVYRGRRVRVSRMIERSLNGVVLEVEPRDIPRPETRVLLSNPMDIDRFGFRSAVVSRTETHGGGERLVFVEIEA